MVEPPIHKVKLVAYIKSMYIDKTSIANDNMYLYATGRNSLADVLLVAIMTGEFDEPMKVQPARTAEEMFAEYKKARGIE